MSEHWSKSLGEWPKQRPGAVSTEYHRGKGIVFITVGPKRILGLPTAEIVSLAKAIESFESNLTASSPKG